MRAEKRLRVLVAREAGLDLVAAAVVETHRQRLLRTAIKRAHDERGALRHHFARLAGPKPPHVHLALKEVVCGIQRAAHGHALPVRCLVVRGVAIAAQEKESAAHGLDDMLLVRQLPDRQLSRRRGLGRAQIDVERMPRGIHLVLVHNLWGLAERFPEMIGQLLGGQLLHAVWRSRKHDIRLIRAIGEDCQLRCHGPCRKGDGQSKSSQDVHFLPFHVSAAPTWHLRDALQLYLNTTTAPFAFPISAGAGRSPRPASAWRARQTAPKTRTRAR